LDYSCPERLAKDKHSSFFGPFIIYKENEKKIELGPWIQLLK